jgi:hypothetical protein
LDHNNYLERRWKETAGQRDGRVEKVEEEEDEGNGEEGGKQEANGAGKGKGAGGGKGEGCDGPGSLDEYGQEYAEGMRIERGRERSRAAAAAAALRQEIKGI